MIDQYLRSIVFHTLFVLSTLVISFMGVLFFLLPRRWTRCLAAMWARWVIILLRIPRIHVIVEGQNNLPRHQPYIIASKHQSAFETIAFFAIFPEPIIVLKRELGWIPFFGWLTHWAQMIHVNRGRASMALRSMVDRAKLLASSRRPLIIFPEGRRTLPGQRGVYKRGVAFLQCALGWPVVPVALNSGLFWPRRRCVLRPGTITIRILPPLALKGDDTMFMERLEKLIEENVLDLSKF